MKRFILCLSALLVLTTSAQSIVDGVVTIEEGTTRIASKQFAKNTTIKEVVIPSSITQIGGGAFAQCSNLHKVVFNAKNCQAAGNIFSAVFSQCKTLSEVVIGDGVVIIPNSLFTGCKGITKVEIPSSVRVIGGSAFSSTNLTEVIIPEGITTLGSFSFGITKITQVTLPASVDSIGEGAFPKGAKIICPRGSYAAQWAATNGFACDQVGTGSVVNEPIAKTAPTTTADRTMSTRKIENATPTATVSKSTTAASTSTPKSTNTAATASTSATASATTSQSATTASGSTIMSVSTTTSKAVSSSASSVQTGRAIPPSQKGHLSLVPAESKPGYVAPVIPNASSAGGVSATAKPVNEVLRIPEGTTRIEDNAYKEIMVRELYIPSTVEYIGKNAFANSKIDTIYFNAPNAHSAATSISSSPFYKCWTAKIVFAKQVHFIDKYMFCWLTCRRNYLEIPGHIESIGDYAFYSFATYTDKKCVILREGVRSIGDQAFHGERTSKSNPILCPWQIVLPKSLEHVGEGGLSLKSELIVSSGSWAEQYAEQHHFIYFHDSWLLHISPRQVKAVGKIKNGVLSFQDGATYIEDNAFANNNDFHTLVIPESMKDLGRDAFDGCNNLKRIEFNAEFLEYGEEAFKDCPNVSEIILGKKVRNLPRSIFSGCQKVTHIDFPESLRYIELWAFLKTGLKDIILPDGVECVDNLPALFHGKIYYPPSVHKMASTYGFDKDTYYGCEEGSYAEKFLAKHNVKYFFRKADLLAGRSVKPDEDFVTEYPGSTELRSENVLPYPDEPLKCSATANMLSWIKNGVLTIPEGTKSLPTYAFQGHREITKIVFPSTLTTIGAYAFGYCLGLKEVTIPGNVKKIGSNAFNYCSYLEKVVLKDGVENIGYNAFFVCPNLKTIEVPASVKNIPVSTQNIIWDGYNAKWTDGAISFDASLIVKRGSYAEKWAIDNKRDYQYSYGGLPEGVTEVYCYPLIKTFFTQRHMKNPYTNGYKSICQYLAIAQILHYYGPPQGSVAYNTRPGPVTQGHMQILFADFDADAKEFSQIKDVPVYNNDEMMATDHFLYNICNVLLNRLVFNDEYLFDLALERGENPLMIGSQDCATTEPKRNNIGHHYPLQYDLVSVKIFDKNASEGTPANCAIPIRESLKRGWPLFISTLPTKVDGDINVGHAFVIDGARMKNGKFQIHVDLGHGSAENGWFDLGEQLPSGRAVRIKMLVPLEGEALANWRPWRLTPEAIAAYKAEKHHEVYFDHGMLYLPEGMGIIYGDGVNEERNTIGHLGVKPEKITSVRMPLTLQVIQMHAFRNCKNLTEITIPENVREWHLYSFANCQNLTTLHYNAIWCDDNANAKESPTWPSLKTITIGPKVERIPAYLFYDRLGIKGIVELPACCKEVGAYAFYRTNLEKIILPKGCKVGENAFPPTATIVYK